MQTNIAIAALAALAQESRFAAFRLLVQAGPQGQSASNIAAALDMPASSLSFHLKELTHAGLVSPRQQGRYIIYAARLETLQRLMEFLASTCGSAGAQSMQERLAPV
jgi:DNA-binding transcriptional ArsR family regulator